MAQNDFLKQYLDAGIDFTQTTQKRAEAAVKKLVKEGQIRQEEASDRVQELIERSRKSAREMTKQIRSEVRDQINNLGLATKADIRRLENRIDKLQKAQKAPAKKAAKKTAAKKKAS
jgi:polyhydroxyalkanoate synthesis regulator phasin